jgi:LysM repeat protein
MRAPARSRDLVVIATAGALALAASGTHLVTSGDTLSEIAARDGTSVRSLVDANGIADPDLILVGQSLTIPEGDGAGGGEEESSSYVVEDGDTLAGIAAEFGTTAAAIAAANGITDPHLIVPGRELDVTGTGGGPDDDGAAPSGGGKQLSGQRHTVAAGDTVAGIASRYGISQDDLARWNGVVDGKLYAGASLVLFDPGSLPAGDGGGSGGAGTYTVAEGDTLGGIASRHGASAAEIASASGISVDDALQIGQSLTLPGGDGSDGDGPAIRCPVPGASYINDWGFPRSGGRSHSGTDLFAPRGTPVHAPVSGWVDIAVGDIGGNQFRLKGDDGTFWYGSHLDDFGARGQVSAGDVIGYVGDSGNAKGSDPHLHFEVHPDGDAVNPYPLLQSTC